MSVLTVPYRALTEEPAPDMLRDQLVRYTHAPVSVVVLGGEARFTVSAPVSTVREAAAFFLDPIGRTWEVE